MKNNNPVNNGQVRRPAKQTSKPAPQKPRNAPKAARSLQETKEHFNLEVIADQIAMALSTPGDEHGLNVPRWASEFSQQQSALGKPFEIIESDWGATASADDQLANGEFLAILKRQPQCSAIVYLQNSAGASKTYSVYFIVPGGVLSSSGTVTVPPEDITTIKSVEAIASTAYAPHGQVLYAGSVDGTIERFLWCDAGDEFTVNITAAANANVTLYLSRYCEHGLEEKRIAVDASLLAGAPQVKVVKATTDPAGYYALSILNKEETPASITFNSISIGGTGSCFAHRALPDYPSNASREQGVRVLGCSLKYTNTSSVLNLAGSISGVQFGEQENWFDFISTTLKTKIASKLGSTTMDIRQGMFGFLKPTQPSDFVFRTDLDLDNNGAIVDSHYPLDHQGAFLLMVGSVSEEDSADGYFTLRYAIEYLSTDTWAELGVSRIPDEVYKRALNKLKNIPQFHENSLHLQKIWDSIKKGFNFVVGNAPKVMGFMEKIAPLFA